MSEALRHAARAIFAEAMRSVDVRAAVRAHIQVENEHLTLAGRSVRLDAIDQVLVIAMGKAAVPMYSAAAEQLGGLPHRAVVVGPPSTLPGAASRDGAARFLPGAHPTPTIKSIHAADAILETLAGTTEQTVVLFLISGGASAMVERPLSAAITLADLALFSRALVGSGMGITEINTLRKHLSAVKGGRLAVAAGAARLQCTLLVSDVPAAAPDAIASGPSLPDSTTVADAQRLLHCLQQCGRVPDAMDAWFRDATLPETPKLGDPAFARAHWQVILSSDHLAESAARAAKAAGLQAVIDNTPDDWEYRAAARYLMDRAAAAQPGTCLISVGEVNVAISAEHGEGGRNQQFALWCAAELYQQQLPMTVLSAGSDGVDGHSDAAGAVCDETTTTRAVDLGLSSQEALAGFNAAPLLKAVGDVIHIGPTGNNLRDLRLLLV